MQAVHAAMTWLMQLPCLQIHIQWLFNCSDLVAELPFILMHPKPEEDPDNGPTVSARPSLTSASIGDAPVDQSKNCNTDANLIQLDA